MSGNSGNREVIERCVMNMKFSLISMLLLTMLSVSVNAESALGRTIVKKIDYSTDYKETDYFDYSKGWAGSGFGLTGTQRGAPEKIQLSYIEGERVLKFGSVRRNAAWLAQHPEASGIYTDHDMELQDDFFLYSTPWVKQDKPYFFATVFLGENSDKATLRAPVTDENGRNHWPGIWHSKDGFILRTTKGDYRFNVKGYYTGWLSLGLAIDETGEMEYFIKYGKHNLEDTFLIPDFRKTASQAANTRIPKIESRRDANIMLSQITNLSSDLTSFDDGKFNAIGSLEYGTDFTLLDEGYLELNTWSENYSLKTPSRVSSVYFYVPNQENLIYTSGPTTASHDLWSGAPGNTYITIYVEGEDGNSYPVELIANKKVWNRELKAEDGVQRGHGSLRVTVDTSTQNYNNLPFNQSFSQVLLIKAQGWHDEGFSQDIRVRVAFRSKSTHKWGGNDRQGTIGSLFTYDNPYSGDRELFRLINLGSDGRYWYFPTDKSNNEYWQYIRDVD